MGIQGLLPFLKKIHRPVNISQFAGCTVAIDAYCWLHKGAFSCADKLALGEKTDQYVYYCLKFINYLLSKNLKPILVFDGCHLPSKKEVEKARREKREQNRKKAAQFLREGKKAEARECLQRCIDITPEMALELMNASVCRERGVDCIVAPYEADAQLAYLNKIGVAQIIITEDSDLLLFGCERVMFKMDHLGNGIMIEKSRLNEVMEIQNGFYTFEKFQYMCILSGCDYLASLHGVGLAKSCKVFKVARQADLKLLLKKLPTYLKMNLIVTDDYINGFIQANNTFLYQLAYDPLQRKLTPLNPYPPDVDPSELHYAGPNIKEGKALQIALGNINIYTGEKFADFDPDTFVPSKAGKRPEIPYMLSIWDRQYRIRPRGPLVQRQEQERPSLHGKEVTVKAKFRKSPQKRLREGEECQDVRSDSELSTLYKSPAKKRVKQMEESGSEGELPNLSSPHSGRKKIQSSSESEDEEMKYKKNRTPRRGSKRFLESLKEASMDEEKVELEDGSGTTIDEKENNIKSPGRNRFALKSPVQRPRFNLNAAKVNVKSRFFASSSSAEKEATGVDKSEARTGTNTETHSGTSTAIHSANNLLSSQSECRTEDGVTHTNMQAKCGPHGDIKPQGSLPDLPSAPTDTSTFKFKNTPSPRGGAFTWSKFKFTRHPSTESLPSKLDNSKTVNGQFKKVVSENNLEKFLRSSQSSSQSDPVEGGSDLGEDIEGADNSVSQSQTSNSFSQNSFSSLKHSVSINSIDSFCMASQDSSFKDTQSSELEEGQNIDVIDLLNSEDQVETSTPDQLKQASATKSSKQSSKTENYGTKPGCRVSGLSRKSKKTKSVTSPGQHSIRDMFSKFAHTKRDVVRLKHKDEKKSAITDTPQGHNSVMKSGIVQRQLLT